jgi:hypothetical protein
MGLDSLIFMIAVFLFCGGGFVVSLYLSAKEK